MSEYKIDEQEWKSWPKAVMMRRDWTTNGHDHRKEVRRYVPDDESVMLRREVNHLRSTIKYLESRIMDSERSDRRLDNWAKRLCVLAHDIACDRNQLKTENAKLRELATETVHLIQVGEPECVCCKHFDECWVGEAMEYSPNGCVICNEARELGIEVK